MKTPLPSRLIRALGPWTATAIVVGTVIGSGVFKKPQIVAQEVPQFGLAALAWGLGGLLAFLGALAYAEVAVLYPRAGGNYVFLREGYGRLAGFLWGWVEFWIIRGASLAALATVFSESLHDVVRSSSGSSAAVLAVWQIKALTVAVLVGLALVNIRGVKWGGILQLIITTVKVASLLGILALPFLVAALVTPGSLASPPQTENLQPVWPGSLGEVRLGGFGTALLGILFAYHGWMNIAPVAEEVKNPQRNLPLSLLGGTLIVTGLYLGANLAYYLVIPRAEMAAVRNTTVATEFCLRLLGPIGAAAAAAAVMASTFGALNGNLLVGPRLLYAMGEDGLAPRVLGAVHAQYRTPAVAIAVMAAWAAVMVLSVTFLTELGVLDARKDHFNILTDFAMFGAIIFETMAVATIFVFRRRQPDAERPYRCWGYPWVPLVYVLILAAVLVNTFIEQTREAMIGMGFIAVGAGLYFGFRLGRHSAADQGK
jgi:APA family basic amino acid/polyamine antiporter